MIWLKLKPEKTRNTDLINQNIQRELTTEENMSAELPADSPDGAADDTPKVTKNYQILSV